MIHVSDMMSGMTGRKGLTAAFRIPKKLDQMEAVANLVRVALCLVDVAATLRLSDKTRQIVAESRREASKKDEEDRRRAMELRSQQRKLERKKQEEENAENLSREAQRKREEKEYKKSLKSRMPRMRVTR